MADGGNPGRTRPIRDVRTDDCDEPSVRDTAETVCCGQDDVRLDERAAAAWLSGVSARRRETMKRYEAIGAS